MRKAVPLDEADPGSSSSEPLKPELEAMMHELRNYAETAAHGKASHDAESRILEQEANVAEDTLDIRHLERSGQVSILGVPNAGKSSLVNALVGSKVSIVTAKPQTTRHRTLGLALLAPRPDMPPTTQAAFVDTAGIMQGASSQDRLGSGFEDRRMKRKKGNIKMTRLLKAMVKTAWKSVREADVLFWVIDAAKCYVYGDLHPESASLDGVNITLGGADRLDLHWWTHPELFEELNFLKRLRRMQRKVHVVLNKTDLLVDMNVDVEDFVIMMRDRLNKDLGMGQDGEALVQNLWPVSVLNEPESLSPIRRWLCEHLPKQSPIYPVDVVTDVPRRVLASEMTREKLLTHLRNEVPHSLTVVNVLWQELEDGTLQLGQKVVVPKQSQLGILKGVLRTITKEAEDEISTGVNLGRPVELYFQVKVDPKWHEKKEYYENLQGSLSNGESLIFNI